MLVRGGKAGALWLLGLCGLAACQADGAQPGPQNNGVIPPPVPGSMLAGSGGAPSVPSFAGSGAIATAGAGAAGSGAAPTPPVTGTIPCDVATIVTNRCQTCHGASLVGGAPMRLVTYADFQADLVVQTTTGLIGQTMKAHALAKQRINATSAPMPPGGGRLADPDFTTLDGWLGAGAPSGPATDVDCMGTVVPTPIDPPPVTVDPNETCYELQMHGGQASGDTSPFTIPAGERYYCFFYEAPWTEQVVATRFSNDFDAPALLHHWLLYTTNTRADGTSMECTGSHIGDNAQLLSGWAVGGQDLMLPADTGLEVPAPGAGLLVEWHLYNTTSTATPTSSSMQICTVPRAARPKLGSMTSLGTEDFGFGIPPGQHEFGSTCVPSRNGAAANEPIHIFAVYPHMHKLGRNLRSVVNRAAGGTEMVFDEAFDFMQQIHYPASIDLMPGDTITSTCTFMNDTVGTVAYGSSTDSEMCYQFVFATPAGALNNGAFGLNGASTNCW